LGRSNSGVAIRPVIGMELFLPVGCLRPQKDGHPGAFLRLAVDGDFSLVRFDDFQGDGQSQPAAFGLGGKEGLENLVPDLRGDSRTGITDLHENPTHLPTGAHGQGAPAHPYIYALSPATSCTAWTFFGSVGKAATSGVTFLFIYLG
jgi:hypothetical protein